MTTMGTHGKDQYSFLIFEYFFVNVFEIIKPFSTTFIKV